MISNQNKSPDNDNKCSQWFLGYAKNIKKKLKDQGQKYQEKIKGSRPKISRKN